MTNWSGVLGTMLRRLEERITRLEEAERVPPRGCICPPGSEATCQGLACPRRGVKFL